MKYIVKKIITLLLTLLVISMLTFIAFQLIPGDSAVAALGTNATKERVEAMRQELGLNQPLLTRYGHFLAGAIQGDFGVSIRYKMPVTSLIRDRFFVTFFLAILSIFFIFLLSFPFGILSVRKEDGILDRCIRTVCQVTMAIPPFFLGMLVTLLFGLVFSAFTPGEFVSMKEDFFGFLYYLIFPALAIALPRGAMLVKFIRSSLLTQLKLDYVRTARSKGMDENRILYRHVLKNALIPVITFFAMMVAEVFAGSIFIEQVFSLPGIGRLLIVGISNRDFPVVSAIILYMASVIVIINFLVDLLYRAIDPRVRIGS